MFLSCFIPVNFSLLSGAVAEIKGFVDDGLFIGQKDPAFLNRVFQLAEQADAARREL